MNEASNPAFKNEANADAYKNFSDIKDFEGLPHSMAIDYVLPNTLGFTKLTAAEVLEKFGARFGVMTMDWYQQLACTTKSYPEKNAIIYPALGLSEEAGEVCGKIKKWLRGDVPELDKLAMTKEMGDVLWYIASLADDLGISMDEIARTNIEKLQKRKQTGTLKGNGDDRELQAI